MNNNEIEAARKSIDEDAFAVAFAVSVWTKYDIKNLLRDYELPDTKANVEAILTPRFIENFNDRMNELSHDVMEAIINFDELPDQK